MTVTVLFVSTGGICRAAMAAGVLRVLAERSGLSKRLAISATAISDNYVDSRPSILAAEAAARRGCHIADLRIRQIGPEAIDAADHILAMDATHVAALRWMAPAGLTDKPRLLMSYAPTFASKNIPDPYGGSNVDYERTMDLIEAGCLGFFDRLIRELSSATPAKNRSTFQTLTGGV